jgi:uncharacterized membrane protein YfcA
MELLGYLVLAMCTATVGALGGLGGAVLLVPILVVAGVPAAEAAPLGLLSVAAGSIAAGPRQLAERSVNHRIGVTTELLASTGAVIGALVSGAVSDKVLVYGLALIALLAAFAGGTRTGMRYPPVDECTVADVGERVGSLDGAYPVAGGIAPYTPGQLRLGLTLMGCAGLVAGLGGTSGGFIKTPAASEIMHVPTKVAAATTTFTVGITSSAALIVMAIQGRIDAQPSAAVIVGSLIGGQIGAHYQSKLAPAAVRKVLSIMLVTVAVILVVGT